MKCIPRNQAQRRYLSRFVPAMILYVVLLLIVSFTFRYRHPQGAMAYGLALLPALPIVAVIGIVGLYLGEETDEFERTVQVQCMLWAIGLTLAVTTVWGFLEMFAGIGHLQPFLAFPMFWFFVGAATPIIRRRYR